MKQFDIEVTDKGIKIKPYTAAAAEAIHTEEFQKGADQILNDFLEAKKNKKD